jgi:hypothetical protein
MRAPLIGLLVLSCCFSLDTRTFAQENTAEVRGRVVDSQDAGIPGVTILVTNEATGVYRHAVSTADGSYFITAIAPGIYTLEACDALAWAALRPGGPADTGSGQPRVLRSICVKRTSS